VHPPASPAWILEVITGCRRVAAIPEGVREVLGLPSVPGGPLPGVPRPNSSRRPQRNLFEEALSETGSAGSVRTSC
jgi:hypothetical protein